MKKSEKNTPIVLLSPITVQELKKIIDKFSLEMPRKILVLNDNEKLAKWASDNNCVIENLLEKPDRKFISPNSNVNFFLAESFLYSKDCIFIFKAETSADNFLLGAIYHLHKLLNQKTINELNYNHSVFELYLYFRESKFICYSEYDIIIGQAWEIDYNLIKLFKLKTSRVYRLFFKTLFLPDKEYDSIRELSFSTKRLYPIERNLKHVINKLTYPFRKGTNAFGVLVTIFSFRWRKYKQRRLAK